MRICLFSTSFFPRIGGAEFVIHYLAKSLTSLGHKVTVLVPKYRKIKEEIECNYNIHRYQLLPRLLFLEPTLMTHLLLEKLAGKFDILHCHFAYPPGYCAIRLKKILKIPIVVTVHGADIQRMPEINYGIRLNPIIDRKVKYTLKEADAITAISFSIKEEIIKAGICEGKVYDVTNGVETRRFNGPITKDVRDMFGLPRNSKIILSVGRNHPKKGYTDLLRALPQVLFRIPSAKCIIVGKGTETLLPLIKQLKLENTLVMPGSIPNEMSGSTIADFPHQDLISIYLSSDIFVLPSLVEGFPLVIPEALASGLPIIATDIPGNRDIIKNGENGLILPPSNPSDLAIKIIDLLKNKSLRQVLSRNAKTSSKNYDWEIVSQKYLQIYENLLDM